MKKILCFFGICALVLSCIFMTACEQEGPPTVSPASLYNDHIVPGVPNQPGSSLIEYDPEREIFFCCEHYMDLYAAFTGQDIFQFVIYSKKPLDLDAIDVDIPTAVPYMEVHRGGGQYEQITELTGNHGMPFWVYQAYREVDFRAFSDLKDAEFTSEQMRPLYEDFRNLKPEDLPVFYTYSFTYYFDSDEYPNEEITYIEVTIDGQTYRPNIGMIRLISTENSPYNYEVRSVRATGTYECYPYNDGLVKFNSFENREVTQAAKLVGIDLLGMDCEVLDMTVTVQSNGMSTVYDMAETNEIILLPGDTYNLEIIFRCPYVDVVWSRVNVQAIVKLEIDNKLQGEQYEFIIERNSYNSFALYAIIFDGVDLEPYYRGYFYQVEQTWRQEYASSK